MKYTIRIITFALLMCISAVGFAGQGNVVLGTYTTANNASAILSTSGVLARVVVYGDGDNEVTVSLYDHTTSNATKYRLFKWVLQAGERQDGEAWPDGLRFKRGLYLEISGTNGQVKVETRIE